MRSPTSSEDSRLVRIVVPCDILRSSGVKTLPLHGEFDQLLLASSEGCGLHLRMRAILTGTRLYYSMLLVVFSTHYPMIVTSNILVINR